jgi:hypothetical protein
MRTHNLAFKVSTTNAMVKTLTRTPNFFGFIDHKKLDTHSHVKTKSHTHTHTINHTYTHTHSLAGSHTHTETHTFAHTH